MTSAKAATSFCIYLLLSLHPESTQGHQQSKQARWTAARNMVKAGIREGVAMSITGHRTRSMFDRYAIVGGDEQRKAMEAVSMRRA